MSGHNNDILADDDDDSRIEARSGNSLLTEFCVEWVSSWRLRSSSVVKEHQQNWVNLAAVLHVVISLA
ncbi:hypothetical protein GQ600_6729 [Phytophthora cactorum]|nr:hypothetical protein GQ600_6729 [Phytophthora cactorum]